MNSIRARSFVRLLWLPVWAGLAVYALLTLWLAFVGLTYPYQLDYGEGIVLWFTRQLSHGQPIYKGLTGLPYASSNYPPLAMLLAALLTPIFGEGYLAGRLMSFASALVVGALIYRIVRVETGTRWLGALAALFFLGSPYVYHWIPQFRADLIGLAFAFFGVYCLWMYTRPPTADRGRQTAVRRPPGYLILGACSFLLALYTKHTLFAAPAAAFLTLWSRNRRLALGFAAGLGIVGGAIYLAVDRAAGGGFTFGLITSNATVFMPELLGQLIANFVETFPVLLMLALWSILGHWRTAEGGRWGILEWYAVTACAGLVMAGRTGAWENYFLESLAILCVFGAIAINRLRFADLSVSSGEKEPNYRAASVSPGARTGRQGSRCFALAVPVLLILQLVLMWHDPRVAAEMVAQDGPANRELAALLARTPGTVISEDMGALTTSGKPVAYYTFQYSSLARSGQWDQSWELNGLRDGAFPLVILERGTREDVDHYRRFTREFVSTLDRYYARVQTIGKYDIYAPAPPLQLQGANFGAEIALVGWSASGAAAGEDGKPGIMTLTLVWQARRAMAQQYTAFVHVENAAGEKIAQDDRAPHERLYPTTRWAAGEMVRETYTLTLPDKPPPGGYRIRVGWYDAEGERLPVPGSGDNTAEIKDVTGF